MLLVCSLQLDLLSISHGFLEGEKAVLAEQVEWMVLCTGQDDDKVRGINFLEKEKCEHSFLFPKAQPLGCRAQ